MQYTLSLTSHHTRQRRLTHTDGSLHTSEWHSVTQAGTHTDLHLRSLSLSTTILSRSTTLHYNSPLLSSLSQHGLSTPGHLHSTTCSRAWPLLSSASTSPPPLLPSPSLIMRHRTGPYPYAIRTPSCSAGSHANALLLLLHTYHSAAAASPPPSSG